MPRLEGSLEQVGSGVFLTEALSLIRGFGELADQIFGLPVYRPEQPEVSGVHAYFVRLTVFHGRGIGFVLLNWSGKNVEPLSDPSLFGKLGKMFGKR